MPANNRQPHRPEIQGLRALAALLVAVYHMWLGRVSGGVDVFIVVSAFLVTTSLMRQVETHGRIAFSAFWHGLARRLLPVSLLVLASVALATIIWIPRERWIATITELWAAGLYVENWVLALRSVDYLADAATASPLQHYWALSVQGQFFVLWPMVIAGSALASRRLGIRARTAVIGAVSVMGALSLAYSIVRTESHQAFAYFDTAARFWEFALGALFALLLPSIRIAPRWRLLAGWLGVFAIIACGLVLKVSTVFPGYAALWPTGAALLVLASHGAGSPWGADRLLSAKPLTWLGDRSYAIYLWHWPLLVFYRVLAEDIRPGLLPGVGIIGAAIALAALSTRFIETPVRYPKVGTGRAVPLYAAASALMLMLALWGSYAHHMKRVDGRILATTDPAYPGAAAWRDGGPDGALADVPVHPGPMAVKSDRPSMLQGDCFQNIIEAQPVSCVYGDSAAEQVIAAVGGSYVAHWIPALDHFARQRGWKVVTFTKNRCWFSTETRMVFGKPYESCTAWNENVIRELERLRPEVVFTNATRGTGAAEKIPPGFVNQWRRVTREGIRIVAVRSTPRFSFDVPDCVARHGAESAECAQERDSVLAEVNPTDRWNGTLPGVSFIDLTEYFCDSVVCPPVIGNILVYSDNSHMTTHYARTLAPMLSEEIERLTTGDDSSEVQKPIDP
ncbi:MAG TPA: acyltransferase family protein [Gemmatimonadaceae bacterium]|nr:acyltransferase family protein [Gemmatimonadaceae bacterium]